MCSYFIWYSTFSVEINLPNGTKSEIRIPPPPEDFYDLEWHNDEWTLPPKELILKMNDVKLQMKRGEISVQEMDIMQCKLILEELKRSKLMKRRPSEMSDVHAQLSVRIWQNTNPLVSQVPRTESIPLRIAAMMSKTKHEVKQYEDWKFEEKINFHLVLLELPVKQYRPIVP